MTDFDVMVIGAGPGGYTAAIRAAQLGAKVALIEKDRLGGTCLNRGCIPTKALLASAALSSKIKRASALGIEVSAPVLNWQKVVEHKNKTVEKLVKGLTHLIRQNKIEVLNGRGRLIEGPAVEFSTNEGSQPSLLSANRIILAAGSEPAQIPGFNLDHETILDSSDALDLKALPQSLAIIGGGVMGVEFASLFAEAGVEVTMIEMLPRLLPEEDDDLSKLLEHLFKRRKIEILTGQKIKAITVEEGKARVALEDGTFLSKEKALITIGRSLNTQGWQEIGLKLRHGAVAVNNRMQTNLPGVYAVGDITGIKLVAHVAIAQGKVAAECALGGDQTIDYTAIPNCIWSIPEAASVGLSEEKAAEIYGREKIKAAKFPFQASGKAQTSGETEGFVKVVVNRETKQILGTHILGAQASTLIAEAALALNLGAKTKDVIGTIHAHPSLTEAFAEAIEAAEGKAIHLANY